MSKHDWQKIEGEYRLGYKSARELSREYGVSHAAITKHMKKHGIGRDLQQQVRAATAAAVVEAEVAKNIRAVVTEQELVTAAANAAAAVEMRQRGHLGKLRAMAGQLAKEPEYEDSMTPLEKERALAGRLSMLVDVEAKLTPLERKVYRLDENEGSETSVEAWLKSQQTAT